MNDARDALLFGLEQRLAQAGKKVSSEEAASLIADDFVEFGASGKVWSKTDILAMMSEWSPIERTVEDFRVRELSPSVCLITYKSSTSGRPSYTLRSSLWRNEGGAWRIVFHQGTSVK